MGNVTKSLSNPHSVKSMMRGMRGYAAVTKATPKPAPRKAPQTQSKRPIDMNSAEKTAEMGRLKSEGAKHRGSIKTRALSMLSKSSSSKPGPQRIADAFEENARQERVFAELLAGAGAGAVASIPQGLASGLGKKLTS